MEDTTDKSSALDGHTDEGADGLLGDKSPEQAEQNTGASQDGTDAHEGATDDGSGSTEETKQEDDSAPEGSDSEESLLTPEEVKNLPPELKASYASMNKRFQQRMADLNARQEALARKPDAPESEQASPARLAVESALQRRGIDPKSLSPEQLQAFEIVADIAMEGGQTAASKVTTPLQEKAIKEEVDAYFTKHPDRAKYRSQMGALDYRTGGKMGIDELFFAVSGADRAKADEDRRQTKLRESAKNNAESASGTQGSTQGEGDIFDEIANAGGHGKNPLLI